MLLLLKCATILVFVDLGGGGWQLPSEAGRESCSPQVGVQIVVYNMG